MEYITDTHSLIWHITDGPEISPRAEEIFRDADRGINIIIIPCIVFFEILYLTEKNKISAKFNYLMEIIKKVDNYKIEPLCLPIISAARQIPRKEISDPWDRLIIATAFHRKLPLVSRDRKIRSNQFLKNLGMITIW